MTDPDAFNAFEAAGWEAKAAGYAAQGSVVGLDISSARVAMASELHPEIEFRRGDAHALPFGDAAVADTEGGERLGT